MPLVAIVVGYAASAAGAAIGTALAGTAFGAAAATIGLSAATLGAAIGAGIAGGALSYASGGSFGKGFVMGAVGSTVGSFLKGGLGSTFAEGGEAATIAADGTTSADILASQGGATMDASGVVTEGIDSAATGGFGEVGAGTGMDTGIDMSGMSADTDIGFGESTGMMSTAPTNQGAFSLDQLGSYDSSPTGTGFGGLANAGAGGMDGGFTTGNMMTPSTGFTDGDTLSGGGYDSFDFGQGQATQSIWDASGTPSQGLEGITSGSTAPQTNSFVAGGPTDTPTQAGVGGGMFKSTDAWLQQNLGAPKGSTGKLLMGGLQTLMDRREANKLQKTANAMSPMTYEQYQQQNMDPQAYRHAANKLAQSGHTGALPVLLARMKNAGAADYTKYRTGMEQRNLENQAAISRMKSNSLQNLFAPYAMNLYQQGG